MGSNRVTRQDGPVPAGSAVVVLRLYVQVTPAPTVPAADPLCVGVTTPDPEALSTFQVVPVEFTVTVSAFGDVFVMVIVTLVPAGIPPDPQVVREFIWMTYSQVSELRPPQTHL